MKIFEMRKGGDFQSTPLICFRFFSECRVPARLADLLDKNNAFAIQIAGERVVIPAGAVVSVVHERSGVEGAVEFQVRWKRCYGGWAR